MGNGLPPRKGHVGNHALCVIGLYGPGDKISLFLKDWELAKVALSCHMALDMLCQEMQGAWWRGCRYLEALCHSKRTLSPTVDGESKGKRNVSDEPF